MKSILTYSALLIILFVSFCQRSFGQTNKTAKPKVAVPVAQPTAPAKKVAALDTSSYDYYIVIPISKPDAARNNFDGKYGGYPLMGQVLDLRTKKVVHEYWPLQSVSWDKSRQILIASSGSLASPALSSDGFFSASILTLSLNGTPQNLLSNIYETPTTRGTAGRFSSDLKRAVFKINNDIFVADINAKLTAFTTPRQVTRFGFKDSNYDAFDNLWGWSGDAIRYEKYRIDLKTGEVSDIPLNLVSNSTFDGKKYSQVGYTSDLRYYIGANDDILGIYDLVSGKVIFSFNKKDSNGKEFGIYSGCFLDDNHYAFIYSNRKFYIKIISLQGDKSESVADFDASNMIMASVNSSIINGGDNSTIDKTSPTKKEYLFIAKDREGLSTKLYLTDPYKPSRTLLDEKVTEAYWIDEANIIYSKMNDNLTNDNVSSTEQGTYVKNIKTGQGKKLFSYPLQGGKPVYVPKLNYSVFYANNQLWRCKPDGQDLEPVTEILEASSYNNHTVFSFLK